MNSKNTKKYYNVNLKWKKLHSNYLFIEYNSVSMILIILFRNQKGKKCYFAFAKKCFSTRGPLNIRQKLRKHIRGI